jgi:hypothetical protein
MIAQPSISLSLYGSMGWTFVSHLEMTGSIYAAVMIFTSDCYALFFSFPRKKERQRGREEGEREGWRERRDIINNSIIPSSFS